MRNASFLMFFVVTLLPVTVSAAIFLVSLPALVSAADYYVDINSIGGPCSDSNPGTINQPFKTLQKGANTVRAGDTLYIRGGRYFEGVSFFLQNGTQNAPITITAYPGERVILDGNNYTNPPPHSGNGLIDVWRDWYIVKNLEVTGSGDAGIYQIGKHNTLDNVFVYKNWGWGSVNTGDYDVVQNSRFWSNSMMNEGYSMTANWGGGVTCARYPDYCTIRNCTSWDNWGEGISTFETMHTTIEDCTSYDNQQNYYISDTRYTVLRRSLSYCTPGNAIDPFETQNGILVGDEKGVPIPLGEGGTRYPSSNNTIINNMVIGCDRNLAAGIYEGLIIAHNTFANCDGDSSEPASVLFYSGAGGVRFINNIIVQDDNLPIALSDGAGVTVFSNNLWSKTPPSSVRGPDDIIADPKLARQAPLSPGLMTPDWFKLASDSPAIDSAVVLSEVSEDFFKTQREVSPDIGAYEYTDVSRLTGDLDNDGDVDIDDLIIVTKDFGKTSGYDSRADTVLNGEIDIYDVVFVAGRFGTILTQCIGTCKASPCNAYTNCTITTGTCSSGYCCTGSCTTPPSGNEIYAASLNPADVQAAVNSASPGDTVVLPAGTYNGFNTQINVPNGVSIRGQGKNSTILRETYNGGDYHVVFAVNYDNTESSYPIKFHDFTIYGNNAQRRDFGISVRGDDVEDIKIYNMGFYNFGYAAIYLNGWIRGVIYNCDFIDNWWPGLGYSVGVMMPVTGDDGQGEWVWTQYPPNTDPGWGGKEFVFIEDCYFSGGRHYVDANYGGRYVFRYNTLDESHVGDDNYAAHINTHHGANAASYGSRALEVYHNTINIGHYEDGIDLQSGDALIWNNALSGAISGKHGIMLTPGGCTHNPGDYPIEAQPRMTYIWGNTENGVDCDWDEWPAADPGVGNYCPELVQRDRDFFLMPKPGYTPYPYPHPLRTG